MGLLNFIGVSSAPKPVTSTNLSPVTAQPAPAAPAAPAAPQDTFESAPAAEAPVDLSGDASFPEWGNLGSGGGGKVGAIGD